MELIRMYDTNEDVLVARKSDYQNNNIGDGYFLVPKDEWFCNDDGIKGLIIFIYFLRRWTETEYPYS